MGKGELFVCYWKGFRVYYRIKDFLLGKRKTTLRMKSYETPPLTSAPSGTRTLDLVIKSHLLYQLS